MRKMKKMILTVAAVAVAAVSARAQVITAPAGQAYTISNAASATAVNPVTYQWYRNNSPISGATGVSYTVPGAYAYGDNVSFYRLARTVDCSGETEKLSNVVTITFTGYIMPVGGCNLIINGVCWADVHVDDFRLFAARADMNTRFYQWNRATAYSTDDPLTPAWNATADNAETWDPANVPCPQDWRLPSQSEYQQLHNSGTTWVEVNTGRGNIVPGRFYGYAHTFCKLPSQMEGCVFFPASGFRSNTNGALTYRGTNGFGWSSTQVSTTTGYGLGFDSTNSFPAYNHSKALGFPVRCVR